MLTMKELKEFCGQFNVVVKFGNTYGHGAAADVIERIIYMPSLKRMNWSDSRILSTLCHELCHILSYDHGKYHNYYNILNYKNQRTPKNKRLIKRIALKAERYTDKMGERLFRTLAPNLDYIRGYDNKHAEKYLRDWLNTILKQ